MGRARRIAIVGAGLGGLAAAIALRQQGFEVQIYEQAPELAEFGAGINISPNSVKFFHAVGLADKLHAISSEPVGLTWRDWDSGEIHNCLPFGDFEKRYGAKYYVVHRSDLHRLLSEAVPQASIQLGKRCTAVESRNGSVGLSFKDGTSAEADVVVGCDGIRSAVRACMFGGEGPHYAGTMCWRALAPSDALPKDYHDRYVNQWSGDGGFVVSYYIRQGEFINFVCVRQQPGWTEQSWSVPSSVDEMLAAFPHAGDKLRRMMAKSHPARNGASSPASTRRNGLRVAQLCSAIPRMPCLRRSDKARTWPSRTPTYWRNGSAPAATIRTRRSPATKQCANRGRPGCSSSHALKSTSRSSTRTGTACAAKPSS